MNTKTALLVAGALGCGSYLMEKANRSFKCKINKLNHSPNNVFFPHQTFLSNNFETVSYSNQMEKEKIDFWSKLEMRNYNPFNWESLLGFSLEGPLGYMVTESFETSPFPFLHSLEIERERTFDISGSKIPNDTIENYTKYSRSLHEDSKNEGYVKKTWEMLLKGVDSLSFQSVSKVDGESHYEALRRLLTDFVTTSDTRLQKIIKHALGELNSFINSPHRNMAEPKSVIWDGLAIELKESLKKHDVDVSLSALKALATLSEFKEHATDIIKKGGIDMMLKALIENLEISPKEYKTQMYSEVARLLANISFLGNHFSILAYGLLDLLRYWSKSDEIQLSLEATRALANSLAANDRNLPKYPEGVFLMSSYEKDMEVVEADVVFVHGLLGNPFFTWRQGTQDGNDPSQNQSMCWPRDWLDHDIPNLRVVAVQYLTSLSEWVSSPYRSATSLKERAEEMLTKLEKAKVGLGRPVIFISHSMGGLLVKQMILSAQQNKKYGHLVDNLKGIVFLSTPHAGSSLATISEKFKYLLLPSVEVEELSEKSEILQSLNSQFRNSPFCSHIHVVNFGETKETMIMNNKVSTMVVALESSNPGFGKFIPVNTDHVNICKPCDKNDVIYQEILSLVKNCLK